MSGRPCSVCAEQLPVRERVKALRRSQVPLREMVTILAGEGVVLGRDALHRHLRDHVADLEVAPIDADQRALLVSVVVRDALNLRWHGIADRIARDLTEHGLHPEAKVIQSAACELMRSALEPLPTGSAPRALLEAEALARALSTVLRRVHPAGAPFAHQLADECERRGADDLADSLRWLAAGCPPTDPVPTGAEA